MITDEDKWLLVNEGTEVHKVMVKLFDQILERHKNIVLTETVQSPEDFAKLAIKKIKLDGMKEFVNEYNTLFKRTRRPEGSLPPV